MIQLLGIATREKSKAPMQCHDQISISTHAGLAGDFRGQPGKRQVTVLSAESWQIACAELGEKIPWTTRRANLLVEGIQFGMAHIGDVIQIGDVKLQVTRETDPCPRMDAQYQGLSQALKPDWRGGVCCRVLQGGDIVVGDAVQVSTGEIASG